MDLFKSILHNLGVLAVGFIFGFIGVTADALLKIPSFRSLPEMIIGTVPLAIIAIFLTDLMIRREEKQLAHDFGEEWARYKSRVPRWI